MWTYLGLVVRSTAGLGGPPIDRNWSWIFLHCHWLNHCWPVLKCHFLVEAPWKELCHPLLMKGWWRGVILNKWQMPLRKRNKDCDDVATRSCSQGRAVSKPLFHCLTDSAPTTALYSAQYHSIPWEYNLLLCNCALLHQMYNNYNLL